MIRSVFIHAAFAVGIRLGVKNEYPIPDSALFAAAAANGEIIWPLYLAAVELGLLEVVSVNVSDGDFAWLV